MSLEAGIAIQQAILQQNVAMSMVRQSAQAERQVADILMQSVDALSSSGRGQIVNVRA